MRTILTVALVAVLAVPASAQDLLSKIDALLVPLQVAEQVGRALERAAEERERAAEEAERQSEERARELERAAEQQERELERAAQERERELERAAQERERAAEQRAREQERAAQERERAAEQRQRELERQAEQRERERERAERDRERERQRAERERAWGGSVQTDKLSRTLKIGTSGEIDISNVAGDIVLTRSSGSEATIDIVKTARARSDEDAKAMLQLVQVDIVEWPNRVEIRTRYPGGEEMRRSNRRNVHVSVAINVSAPAGTRVRAQSISGSVSAKDIRGEMTLESVSGAIRVANGGRVAAAKSISGDVEVIDTDSEGVIEASTASGSVTLRRVKARALDLGSISGHVVVEDAAASMVEAQTVSGGVRLSGTIAKGGRYELSSHSGSVEVAISGGAGFEVEATSFSGSVQSDLPVKAQDSGGGGRGRPRALRGVYGDGSAVLDLSTFSGSIVISKR
jgi:DUF4097 and DUF4098 domain-containing protein YvlB